MVRLMENVVRCILRCESSIMVQSQPSTIAVNVNVGYDYLIEESMWFYSYDMADSY